MAKKRRSELTLEETYDHAVAAAEYYFIDETPPKAIDRIAQTIPRSIYEPFNELARHANAVDRRTGERPQDHLYLLRALGFGATTGIVLGRMALGDCVDDKLESVGFIQGYSAHTAKDVGATVVSRLGKSTEAWLEQQATAMIPVEDVRPWFSIGAGLMLDCIHDYQLGSDGDR